MLADALLAAGQFKATIVGSEMAAELFPELDRAVLRTASRGFGRILRAKIIWPLRVGSVAAKLAQGNPHIVHGLSNFNIPFRKRYEAQRRVLTVHDLVPLLAPESVSALQALQLKVVFGPAVRSADRIICISHWTRQTLVERYPEVADRCVVIPNGVPETPDFGSRSPRKTEAIQILTISRYEPYKRLDLLLQILRALPTRYSSTLVTSAQGEAWCRLEAKDLLDAKRLVVRHHIPAPELAILYKRADLLLHPSRLEGFCLPAVEALASGCPVVFQSGSAMNEILTPSVSVAIEPGAKLNHWVQAVEIATAMSQAENWHDKVMAHYATLPTWKDAAHAVQTLYSNL